jgi:DNA-binding transcriptional LysR family regulator
VDLDQIEVFLTLAEELHFGRTAARLHMTQPRVSKQLASLERSIGGLLFDRTSRQVRPTGLGDQLRRDLSPAYASLHAAVQNARQVAHGVHGTLVVGFTATTAFEVVSAVIRSFVAQFPPFAVVQRDVDFRVPYVPLRTGAIDVLINWIHPGEPDLTIGPVIDRQRRILAVSTDHPLANRQSVSIEELAGLPTPVLEGGVPQSLHDMMSPSRTPTGSPIPRAIAVRSMTETLSAVAAGTVVHPTTESVSRLFARRDIAWVPIVDLPPVDLGLVWLTGNTNPCLPAFASVAAEFSPSHG